MKGSGPGGSGGSGGAGNGASGRGGNAKPDEITPDDVENVADAASARDAATGLGMSDTDAEHFAAGSKASDTRYGALARPPSGSGNGLGLAGSAADIAAFRGDVGAYGRKYGRRAALAYARGRYWSLLKLIRAGIAVYNIATGAPSSPAVQAVNSAILASYWLTR